MNRHLRMISQALTLICRALDRLLRQNIECAQSNSSLVFGAGGPTFQRAILPISWERSETKRRR
jgi:hypothetical protein